LFFKVDTTGLRTKKLVIYFEIVDTKFSDSFLSLYVVIVVVNLIVKLEEGSRVENLQAQRCRARLDHLESADAENLSDWNNTRLKRILVDYMLRMSYYDTALKLAESSNLLVILLVCLLIIGEFLGVVFFIYY
jgi:hypothetical protein